MNYLNDLEKILRIPSISTQDKYKKDMEECRKELVSLFTKMGFQVKILPASKHPAVFAQKIGLKGKPTVLVYGHYDVQPPDPLDQWKTPPFEPTVKDGKIFGRGTTDNKGQFMIHIMAVKKLLEKSNLPLNFKFLIEGEEEIGSPSVKKMAQKYKDLLKADYIIVSDSEMIKKGSPSIDISLRGLLYTEIMLETSKQDLHSGAFGGVAENPAIALSRIICQLKDNENKILIPGFYKKVKALSPNELTDYRALEPSQITLKKEGGLNLIGGGEAKYSLNERRWARPTLDINGFISGYTGEGSKTIIPARATAKISMRLVPNQIPEEIFKLFVSYIKKITPKGIKVSVKKLNSSLPYKAPTTNPVFNLIKESLKKIYGKKALFIASGGSIGFLPILSGILKVPCVLVGFGLPGDNIHSPNENFSLDNYEKGIRVFENFYKNLGTIDKKRS